jgi:hypothetical protein
MPSAISFDGTAIPPVPGGDYAIRTYAPVPVKGALDPKYPLTRDFLQSLNEPHLGGFIMNNTARGTTVSVFVTVTFALFAIPLFAHHGTAASYDQSKTLTLTGVVTEFVFANPHSQIYFDVTDSSGKVVSWGGEMQSPGNLRREGWSKTTFKPGDKITLTVNPSKAGTPVGVVDRSKPITLNGKELPGRAANAE